MNILFHDFIELIKVLIHIFNLVFFEWLKSRGKSAVQTNSINPNFPQNNPIKALFINIFTQHPQQQQQK
jgi:hypothetical protein